MLTHIIWWWSAFTSSCLNLNKTSSIQFYFWICFSKRCKSQIVVWSSKALIQQALHPIYTLSDIQKEKTSTRPSPLEPPISFYFNTPIAQKKNKHKDTVSDAGILNSKTHSKKGHTQGKQDEEELKHRRVFKKYVLIYLF